MDHLFVSCSFSKVVWKEMISNYNLQNQWDKPTLLECLESWITYRFVSSYKALPCYVIWGIWLSRNNLIFEDKEAHLGRLSHQIRVSFGEGRKPPKHFVPRNLQEPSIDFTRPWGFFDGACQGTPGICGAGAILYLDNAHHFSLKYGVGRGTNNRAEIYALWILLKVVVDKQVRKIQVLGDSKLVMDWANGKAQITNMVLGPNVSEFQLT
jgi:hypothetical protein